MSPFIAELLGTMTMILLGDGVVANVVLKKTKGFQGGWITITTAWALAVFTGVVIAGPYSGAHLNPAITIGFAIAEKFPWASVPSYVIAQMLGAALGAFLVWIIYYDHFKATEEPGTKLGVFCTAPEIRHNIVNFGGELIATFVLMFSVFYITGAELIADVDTTTPIGLGSIGAIPVSFIVWVIGLSLGGVTGYAINPARDFAPRVMHAILPIQGKGSSQWDYAWIPILGPLAGSLVAAIIYMAI